MNIRQLKMKLAAALIASATVLASGVVPAAGDEAPDLRAPLLLTAGLADKIITLSYDEPLHAQSLPGPDSFYVKVAGQPAAVAKVAVEGSAVRLTLAEPPAGSGSVLLTYLRGAAGIADLSGNPADNLIERPVSRPDGEPPVLASAAVDGAAVVLAYNEPLDPASVPSASNMYVKVNGAVAAVDSVAVSGAEVRVALRAAPVPGQSVLLTYIRGASPIRDAAGNPAPNLLDRSVSNPISAAAPGLLSATASGDRVTLSYSQNLNGLSVPGPDSFAIQTGAGTIPVTLVAVNGPSVTLRLASAVLPGETVSVSYTPPPVGALRTSGGILAPAVAAYPADNRTDGSPPALTGASWSGTQLRLRYNEELLAGSVPPASSFTVRRGSAEIGVSGVSLENDTVVLTLQSAIPAGSTVTVSYAAPDSGGTSDPSGNSAANLFNQPVADSGDTTPPQLVGAQFAGTVVTLLYSETLSPGSVPPAGSFQVTAGGTARTVTAVAVTGSQAKLTLAAPEPASSALSVTYAPPAAGALQDLNGNRAPAAASFPAGSADDKTAPTLASVTANGFKLTLTFSEPLRQQPVPAATSFTVTANGEARHPSAVGIQGSVVTLTLGTAVAAGQTVTLSYSAASDGLADLSGNTAAPFAGRQAANVTDLTPPTVVSAIASGLVIILTYNEQLDAASVPPASSFTLGGGNVTITAVAVAGSSVTLTLSGQLQGTGGLTLNYYPSYGNALRDLSGNQAASLYGQTLTGGADTVQPTVTGASASNSAVSLEYSEELDTGSVPSASRFAVQTSDRRQLQVSGTSVSGRTVTLTMAAPLQPGQTLTVSYDAGAGGQPVKDKSGNAAAAMSGRSVTVPGNAFALTGASASGASITLTFSSRLRPSPVPAASEFRVTAGGRTIAVVSASIEGHTLKLTLEGEGIKPGQTASVSYEPGQEPLQDEWGAFLPAFQGQPAAAAPAGSSGGPQDGPPAAGGSGGAPAAAAYDLEWPAAQADVSYETGTGGKTGAVYRIKTEAVGMLDALKGRPSPNVRIAAAGGETVSTALIPASAFTGKSVPAGLRFTFETEKGSMVVPADWIDAAGLAKQFRTGTDRLAVGFSIGEAAVELSGEIAEALKAKGMEAAAPPLTYEVFIEAEGKRYQMSAFNQYLNRKVRLPGPVSLKDTTIVWYNRQTKEFEYVPSIFANADARSHAVIKHMRTGTYVVVRKAVKFADMGSHWARTEVDYLASKQLIAGRTETEFDPGSSMTKAEFATLLVRSLGLADLSETLPYKDVPDAAWYRPYVGAAYAMRIADGGSEFQPGKPVTRAEIAVMTYRAVQLAGRKIALTDMDGASVARYKDIGALGANEREAAAAVIKAGFMGGVSETAFSPQSDATRAEAAVILGRMLRYVGFLN